MRLIAVLSLLVGTTIRAEELNLTHQDKQLHIATSFGLTLALERVYVSQDLVTKEWAWPVALGTTMVLGLAKESLDNKFSTADVGANFIGGAWASFFCWTF